MADGIQQLQQQLSSGCEVCCSKGMLDKFPDILSVSFLVEHVGIIVCHRGQFTVMTAEEAYTVESGKTLFVNRGTSFHVADSSPDILYSLLFYRVDAIKEIIGNTVMGMKFLEVINPRPCQIVDSLEAPGLNHYIAMFSELPDNINDVFIEKERLLLMLSLTYRLCYIIGRTMSSNNTISGRHTTIYIELMKLVGKHYDSERGVAFYADKLCLSPKYLSSIVKSVSGLTVQQHVFKAIVRRSIFLMNNTDKSVKEISDSLHFPNPAAFGTFFKKQTGMSPRHFRKRNIRS